ncbi:MAG: BamA/TamA family outer membrane protein [Acidobacteriota bacterium]
MIIAALLSALFMSQTAALPEVLTQIQVRGNVATSDQEVQDLAGLQIGMPVAPDIIATVTTRLRTAKRFDRVEVLKRYAALNDPTQIVIVVIVDEGPVSIKLTGDPDHPTRVVKRWWPTLLFVPIIRIESGYGATYGVRLTHPDPVGHDSRLSFPATWGGEKRIGTEFEKRFPHRWLTRVEAGGTLSRRTNPLFETNEDTAGVFFRAERQFTSSFRVRALSGWQAVSFRESSDRVATVGAEAILDTRLDPFLARDAVFVRARVSRLALRQREGINRTELEGHGYVGLVGQTILVASAKTDGADGALPDYLKPLFGGPSSVRGFKTGTAAGDSLVSGSLELRVPLTSPLSFGKVGVSAFVDAGTIYNEGQRFVDQPWRRGVGGSVWFTAAFVRVNVSVAHGIGASTRVQVQGNLTY